MIKTKENKPRSGLYRVKKVLVSNVINNYVISYVSRWLLDGRDTVITYSIQMGSQLSWSICIQFFPEFQFDSLQ